MIIQNIDKGNPFDLGKTSEDYAKYRDIYPQEFYDYILALGLCKNGQKVLDIEPFTRSGCRMNICNILTWYHRMSSESTSRLPEIPGMGGCGHAGA